MRSIPDLDGFTGRRRAEDVLRSDPRPPTPDLARLSAELSRYNRELQEALEQERAAHQQARAVGEARSQLVATMSHELRTPLSAILGFADLLEAEIAGPLNEAQRAQITRIRTGAHHLIGVIDEILALARLDADREEIRVAPTDLVSLAHETVWFLAPQASAKGVLLRTAVPGAPILIETDAGKVRQILLNLLGNALKFTDRGEIGLEVTTEAGCVHVGIRDTGPGIDADDLERIFEPFAQASGFQALGNPGTGLGLAVSRRLARLLGGDVTVESTPGVGSRFTLQLPLSAAPRLGF